MTVKDVIEMLTDPEINPEATVAFGTFFKIPEEEIKAIEAAKSIPSENGDQDPEDDESYKIRVDTPVNAAIYDKEHNEVWFGYTELTEDDFANSEI